VLALAARAALLWLRDLLALRTGTRVVRELRGRLLDHMIALGPGHQWQGGAARAHLALVDGCEHLRGYVGSYLPQAIASILVPAVALVTIATRDLTVALVILVMLLGVPLGQRATRALLGERAAAHWMAYERYGARITDSVAGISTLAGLGAAPRRARVLAEEADHLREATTRNMNVSLTTSVVTSATMLLGTSGATLLAAWHAAQGSLEPGAVVLVLFLAAECFRPLQDLQNYWHEGFYGLSAAGAINTVLATPVPVTNRPGARPVPLTAPPGLEVSGVSFRYPGAHRDALQDVTAHVPAGRTTALVGVSGSGKTTLTSLLLRDVDPSRGHVDLCTIGPDGREEHHDLRDLPLEQIRRITARVSQDVVLFDGTLRENLEQAAPGGTAPEDLADAIGRARVDEFLPRLPLGLDSPVGEGGRLLSGGQRQRVALARALVQDAPVLVLDEATSALDGENEALISESLHSHRGERTVLVIAHRLSTVADADHVIVLEDGRVLEQGRPQDLERAGGAWAQMVRAQHTAMTGASR
jgi:ATP-binding cassette subfamily B protein